MTYQLKISSMNLMLAHQSKSRIRNPAKGQLISKGLFGIHNSPKKRMKKFDSTTMVSQIEMFFVRFLGEFEDIKKTFRN